MGTVFSFLFARPFLYVVFATWFRQVESRHPPPLSKNTIHMYLEKVVQGDVIDSHFVIGLHSLLCMSSVQTHSAVFDV